ncbi:MAG: uracil-DNA glycosylase [Bacteroidota bacterium]
MELNLNADWQIILKEDFEKTYFKKLGEFISEEYTNHPDAIFPKKEEIFAAFNACSLSNVRVVILGQDPYPTRGHAHGLSFSVQEVVHSFPKSLKNIFKEVESDLGLSIPENGNLQRWANQGVLLLNATLTVREGKPESHANRGWEQFTDSVLKRLNDERKNVVYLLWGSKAQSKTVFINSTENLILMAPHPSPLSAYRGFFGCKHFSQANEYLKKNGRGIIEW